MVFQHKRNQNGQFETLSIKSDGYDGRPDPPMYNNFARDAPSDYDTRNDDDDEGNTNSLEQQNGYDRRNSQLGRRDLDRSDLVLERRAMTPIQQLLQRQSSMGDYSQTVRSGHGNTAIPVTWQQQQTILQQQQLMQRQLQQMRLQQLSNEREAAVRSEQPSPRPKQDYQKRQSYSFDSKHTISEHASALEEKTRGSTLASTATTISKAFASRPPRHPSTQNRRLAHHPPPPIQAPQRQPSNVSENDIDLDFVEMYDLAFDEFLNHNPQFTFNTAPDLIHAIRVAKLQKLLERQDMLENELIDQFQVADTAKQNMEAKLHAKLKDAARFKAARETQTRANLNEIRYRTKLEEARMTWHIVEDSLVRSKKQFSLDHALQLRPVGRKRMELIGALPQDLEFLEVRQAAMAPGSSTRPVSLEEQRQLQMNIAFKKAELSVLQRKVEYQKKIHHQQYAWVENILWRMDGLATRRLKDKYMKKAGVKF